MYICNVAICDIKITVYYMFMIIFLCNAITMLFTYALFCNTAYAIKTDTRFGMYYLHKKYITPDLIKIDMDLLTAVCALILVCNPVTFLLCVCVWVCIYYGYLRGDLEVFGRSNGVC